MHFEYAETQAGRMFAMFAMLAVFAVFAACGRDIEFLN